MILGALAEGFGLLMIVPIASIAMSGGDSSFSHFLPWFPERTAEQRLFAAIAMFVAAMGVRSLLLHARDRLLAVLQAGYEADLKLRAAATLAARGWPFASNIGQAGMQSMLLSDVPRVGKASASLQSIAVSAIMLAVQLGIALWLSTKLALVAVAFMAVGFLASAGLARKGVQSGQAITRSTESSAGAGFRLHGALKAALAQATVGAFLEEYRSSLTRVTAVVTAFTRDYSIARQTAAFGATLAAALILLVGIQVLDLPFPVLAASLVVFARMSAPAQLLQGSLMRLAADASAFAATEARLGKLEPAVSLHDQQVEALDWTRLDVDGVGFEHKAGLGVRHATLQLQRGDWIGIAGASGAGKTTLIDLIAGLISPQRGSIRIDGHALDGATLQRWRAGIAYVGQEGAVFNDSVRSNLCAEVACEGDERLWGTLEIVGLAARVRAFAGGLDEPVGDRGSQLSGGERQRLVLARALLRQPSLLILDEATSALDPQAEAALLTQLKQLTPRPAALVVAHRRSTLNHCESLVAIQHGKVSPP